MIVEAAGASTPAVVLVTNAPATLHTISRRRRGVNVSYRVCTRRLPCSSVTRIGAGTRNRDRRVDLAPPAPTPLFEEAPIGVHYIGRPA